MNKTVIISIIYREPSWQQTYEDIQRTGLPVIFVNREGTGSLAKAINDGVRTWKEIAWMPADYLWIVTNVRFKPQTPLRLAQMMDVSNYAAISPRVFTSDHLHMRQPVVEAAASFKPVPFIEFIAPIVRADVFAKNMLDEDMPYWGHDLDWGYRMWKQGFKIGVDYGSMTDHTYCRSLQPHYATLLRYAKRSEHDAPTLAALQRKYGNEWRDIIFPTSTADITRFCSEVTEKKIAYQNF